MDFVDRALLIDDDAVEVCINDVATIEIVDGNVIRCAYCMTIYRGAAAEYRIKVYALWTLAGWIRAHAKFSSLAKTLPEAIKAGEPPIVRAGMH